MYCFRVVGLKKLDKSFLPDTGLEAAIELLREVPSKRKMLPEDFPESGFGELVTLELLAPYVLGGAAKLDDPKYFAHMDPPTPWITWATSLWNARLNQNLLHHETGPFALEAEKRIINWLAPYFGMEGGHMCSGSTLANLTALWAARESGGVEKIVASDTAHLSIVKASKILGLPIEIIESDSEDKIIRKKIGDLSNACLVLTAGTTKTGVIDDLSLVGSAKWTHVDGAWAGPLRFSRKHAKLLDGIEKADSVSVSAHKWLFQPKESALILFKNNEAATREISFGGEYMSSPNIGVQGSRGASAVSLLATVMAWGREGIAHFIDLAMSNSEKFAIEIQKNERISLWAFPQTGVTVFRPVDLSTRDFMTNLPSGMFSSCNFGHETWVRSVAANPMTDIEQVLRIVKKVLSQG